MNSIKTFFAGVFSVFIALLALLFMRSRKQAPLTKEAQEAVDKLEDIKLREENDAKFMGQSDADIVLGYIQRKESERRKNSGSK